MQIRKEWNKNKISKQIDQMFDRYFELCDEDESGTIDKKEFYTLLRLNVVDYKDRNLLKDWVNDIYSNVVNSELTKDQFKRVLLHNKTIRSLIDKTIKVIKDIDAIIDSDLEKMFQTAIGKVVW